MAFIPKFSNLRKGSRLMAREIRLNAFDMNCVGHQSPGLWAHPRDRSWQYKDLEYWDRYGENPHLEGGKFERFVHRRRAGHL